jgi:hypothetical protein
MGKRGAKSKFTGVSRPNKDYKLYGVAGKENGVLEKKTPSQEAGITKSK